MSHSPDRPETSPAAPRRRPRRWLRRLGWTAVAGVAVLLAAAAVFALWLRAELHASLPRLDGEVELAGLEVPVTIERDRLGVPTVRAASRGDAAFALGYLHAQERFFQMDLQRRSAAGELAEMFGAPALASDRRARLHRFRHRARGALESLPGESVALIDRYTAGVNAGLGDLGSPPFEYLALRTEPAAWRPEDTLLTGLAMYRTLQGGLATRDRNRGLMRDRLDPELVAFLLPPGNSWDAPLTGGPLPAPPPPAPDEVALAPRPVRAAEAPVTQTVTQTVPQAPATAAEAVPGSNAWALAGAHTAGGGALVANDMHLGLGLPNIWYRASLVWPDGERRGGERRVTGATLPGTPVMVIGSNGTLAWGFTNGQVDTADLVIVEVDTGDPERYRTPDGWRRFTVDRETFGVLRGDDEVLEVRSTVWGPVIGEDHHGRPLALAWVAHRPGAIDLELAGLETAETIEQAAAVANRSGLPAQNMVLADAGGRIGWTVAGRLPRRRGDWDPRFPTSWSDGERGWDGLLPPETTPRLLDPEEGRLWSANHRHLGDEGMALLGDGDFVTAARAGRIRDRLQALDAATPADMLAIQLDAGAFFLDRWRRHLDGVLERALDPTGQTAEASAQASAETGIDARGSAARYAAARRALGDWTGEAVPEVVSYRLVRGVRNLLADRVFAYLTAPCSEADPSFDYTTTYLRYEGPLWQLVTRRPAHLLDPRFESWDAVTLAALDDVLDFYQSQGWSLEQATWGRYNTIRFQHPLSRAVPRLSRWLDMPPAQLAGDAYMPRVVQPGHGASERMAVSPGREDEGYFHMPGGQSGHPLSPHYGDSHHAWETGEPLPFLPGPTEHTLRLVPGGG